MKKSSENLENTIVNENNATDKELSVAQIMAGLHNEPFAEHETMQVEEVITANSSLTTGLNKLKSFLEKYSGEKISPECLRLVDNSKEASISNLAELHKATSDNKDFNGIDRLFIPLAYALKAEITNYKDSALDSNILANLKIFKSNINFPPYKMLIDSFIYLYYDFRMPFNYSNMERSEFLKELFFFNSDINLSVETQKVITIEIFNIFPPYLLMMLIAGVVNEYKNFASNIENKLPIHIALADFILNADHTKLNGLQKTYAMTLGMTLSSFLNIASNNKDKAKGNESIDFNLNLFKIKLDQISNINISIYAIYCLAKDNYSNPEVIKKISEGIKEYLQNNSSKINVNSYEYAILLTTKLLLSAHNKNEFNLLYANNFGIIKNLELKSNNNNLYLSEGLNAIKNANNISVNNTNVVRTYNTRGASAKK